MTRLLGLADALRSEGLRVVEIPGWQTRGAGDLDIRVIVVHHTASQPGRNAPSLNIVTNGRPRSKGVTAVRGPLAGVLIGRDSTCYVIASGVSNNAGLGGWAPASARGNRHTFGIEVENRGTLHSDGTEVEPWPPELYDVTARVCKVVTLLADLPNASRSIGHKEWTRRKVDPRFVMAPFRGRVAHHLRLTEEIKMGIFADVMAAYAGIENGRNPSAQEVRYWSNTLLPMAESERLIHLNNIARDVSAEVRPTPKPPAPVVVSGGVSNLTAAAAFDQAARVFKQAGK